MSTPIVKSIEWADGLHKMLGDQVVALNNRLSSWLLLGNVGALVLLFNAKLGRGFISTEVAREMAHAFSIGLFAAFIGIALLMATYSWAYHLTSKSVGAMHAIMVNNHYIEELEKDGYTVPDDNGLVTGIEQATGDFEKAKKKIPTIWVGVVTSIIAHLVSAIAFAMGVLAPLS